MRKSGKPVRKIEIDGMSWSERELAQIIRRKMLSKQFKNKKKYDRNSNKQAIRDEHE